MHAHSNLTTATILAAFTQEVQARGGTVTGTFDDSQRLFTRSVLPQIQSLRLGDKYQCGVALRATEEEVWLHPYLFRLVCKNGAIVAQTLGTRHFDDLHLRDADEALHCIRDGFAMCCSPEAFQDNLDRLRTAREMEADLALGLMSLATRPSTRASAQVAHQMMDQFLQGHDRSRYGLANVLTAIARDTRDPELRWDLEELGGTIATGTLPDPPRDYDPVAMALRAEAAPIG